MDDTPIIQCEDACFAYPNGVQAIDHINLEITRVITLLSLDKMEAGKPPW